MNCNSKSRIGQLVAVVAMSLCSTSISLGQQSVIVMDQPATIQAFTYSGIAAASPVVLDMPMAYWGGASDGLHSLHDPSVMKDLELVEDQVQEINRVRQEFNKRRNEMYKAMGSAKKSEDKELLKQLQKELAAIGKEQQESLSNVLLPHQLDRIKQVNHQMNLKAMGGVSGALQHGQLAKELEMTDEQKKKLSEIQKQMNEEIAARTKEIREKAKKDVMSELSAKQKQKLKDLTGAEFKRDPNDWQEHVKRLRKPSTKKK